MPDPRVIMFEGKKEVFPADFTDADISAALGAIPAANAANVPNAKTWSTPSAVKMAATARGVPAAAEGAMELATNPGVVKGSAAIGRTVGAIGPTVGELAAGNVPAAIAMAANSGKTGWAGGKTGWQLGRLTQKGAAPVAKLLEKAAPYAQALSTLAGAQGVNDLAQMAEPDRQDIGFLGMGPSAKVGAVPNADAIAKAPPEDVVKALVAAGWTEPRAKSYVLQMRKLMANR